jgi:cell division protein FtsL
MSSLAQAARPSRAGARSRARARARPRLLGGGVLWIVLFAVLLAGVVAVNVTVLRLNLELDRADRERAELKADVARLRSELSSASASARIERLARKELGLAPADPERTVYVPVEP